MYEQKEITKFKCKKCDYSYIGTENNKKAYISLSGRLPYDQDDLIMIDEETLGLNVVCEGCGRTTQLIIKEAKLLKK